MVSNTPEDPFYEFEECQSNTEIVDECHLMIDQIERKSIMIQREDEL